jgi:hypothetical protein
MALRQIHGAAHSFTPFVHDVRVDHGRAHIFVPQQFLDSSYVITGLQKMGCEAVPKGMRASGFGNVSRPNRLLYSTLQSRFVDMVSSDPPGSGIDRAFGGREHILPTLLPASLGILLLQGEGQIHLPQSLPEIFLVESLDFFQVSLQRLLEGFGQNRYPIFLAFSISHHYLAVAKVDILHPQPKALHQSEA